MYTLDRLAEILARSERDTIETVVEAREARLTSARMHVGGVWATLSMSQMTRLQTLASQEGLLRFRVRDGLLVALQPWDRAIPTRVDVVDAMREALSEEDGRDWEVETFTAQGSVLHVRVLDRASCFGLHTLRSEDVGRFGLHLRYSEEYATLRLGALLWRKICANGAYGTVDEIATIDARSSILAHQELRRKIVDTVRGLGWQASDLARQMREAGETPANGTQVVDAIDATLLDPLLPIALDLLEDDGSLQGWVNAFTAAARTLDDMDDRTAAERAVVRLLLTPLRSSLRMARHR